MERTNLPGALDRALFTRTSLCFMVGWATNKFCPCGSPRSTPALHGEGLLHLFLGLVDYKLIILSSVYSLVEIQFVQKFLLPQLYDYDHSQKHVL